MTDYKPQALDKKWQQQWTASKAFEADVDPSRDKFYCLEMFAYPSGHAHVGHVRNYIIGDVMARTKRMRGCNVLHPFGWDAFGLPAENAAIKTGTHPETSTLANIAHMKGQLQRLGISYAWDREIATCLPDYYKFNQWIFLKMFERGLAYRRRSTVNWCETDKTVLANEQVVDGACWRCGNPVVTRELEQWFFRITQYADELLEGLDTLGDWPEKVVVMQRNWIGRSEGARIRFPVAGTAEQIEVFTTRIDTIYGATFVLVAPEHPMVDAFAAASPDPDRFRKQLAAFRALDREARLTGAIEKEGFDTGRKAINPFTKEEVPIWIANFVLAEYGTGAIMAVPAHDQRDFEFARKYGLPIRVVVVADPSDASQRDAARLSEATTNYGTLVDSGPYSGRAGARRDPAHDSRRGGGRHRQGRGAVPAQGLGHLAAALLGHADSGGALPDRRGRGRALRSAASRAAEGRQLLRARRLAACPDTGVREHDVSEVRRAGAPRNRHDGHVRRLVVVFPAVLRPAQHRAAVRSRAGRLLDAGRLLQRRRRARDPAPAVLAVLHARAARRRPDQLRRAVQAAAHAGDGAEERRRHVEIQGQRRRSRRHDRKVRRRRAPALCDVRGAAREGSRVERRRARGQLPVPAQGVAAGRPLGRDDWRRRSAGMRSRLHRGRAGPAPQDARHHPPRHRRHRGADAPQHRGVVADGARQRAVRLQRGHAARRADPCRGAGGAHRAARRPSPSCARRSTRWC